MKMLSRLNALVVAILAFGLIWAGPITLTSPAEVGSSSTETIRTIVDRIELIEGLPPKRGAPQTDPNAAAIVALGYTAGPFLVDRLTDAAPSKVVYEFQYAIGDVALFLLNEIYKPAGWPFPDGSEKLREQHGDYRDYVNFVDAPGARKRLQDSWRKFISSLR